MVHNPEIDPESYRLFVYPYLEVRFPSLVISPISFVGYSFLSSILSVSSIFIFQSSVLSNYDTEQYIKALKTRGQDRVPLSV